MQKTKSKKQFNKTKIIITDQSIKNRLDSSYNEKPEKAILEYIWNGFDAEASNVFIDYSFPQKVNGFSFGYPDLEIRDDGKGWNIENESMTNLFLVSPKKHIAYKSLPQGKEGIGRFTFYSFANSAKWETIFNKKHFSLALQADSLNECEWKEESKNTNLSKGTRISFSGISEKLNEEFFEKDLIHAIKQEFCWFLKLFPARKIFINGEVLDISDSIEKEIDEELEIGEYTFDIKLVQWKLKPFKESSKYYFLDKDGMESFNDTSGLNYKSDEFFHSVYVKSDFFNDHTYWEEVGRDRLGSLLPEAKIMADRKETYKKLVKKITERAENMRKPHLKKVSRDKVEEWKKKGILPKVTNLGLDQKEYEKIIQSVYVTAPRLFSDSSDEQRKVILRFFSSLMSTEEKDFILKILDEVYKLSEKDKGSLGELLERATLSNIIRTLKEIDNRLNILNSLEEILLNTDKSFDTKEVVHLQKILDQNFWVFGEGYRLFSSTEGAISKTLVKFKNDILRKEKESIETKSRKELDLFLTKTEITSEITTSIIVEIKRPSVTLGKDQLDQIKEYMDIILQEPACNGKKAKWIFCLIGCDYNKKIVDEIASHKSWGEEDEGLAHILEDGRIKLYVKKWSDIINVDQKSKYKYLQDKLQLELKNIDDKNSEEIVKEIVNKK